MISYLSTKVLLWDKVKKQGLYCNNGQLKNNTGGQYSIIRVYQNRLISLEYVTASKDELLHTHLPIKLFPTGMFYFHRNNYGNRTYHSFPLPIINYYEEEL